jgi:uncharacterized protein with GYD domain
MATYLLEVSYTSTALAALIKNPQDRVQVVSKSAEKLGGKLIGAWLTFGDSDVIAILEMPDNAAMAALSLAIGAGWGVQQSEDHRAAECQRRHHGDGEGLHHGV